MLRNKIQPPNAGGRRTQRKQRKKWTSEIINSEVCGFLAENPFFRGACDRFAETILNNSKGRRKVKGPFDCVKPPKYGDNYAPLTPHNTRGR